MAHSDLLARASVRWGLGSKSKAIADRLLDLCKSWEDSLKHDGLR